MDAEHNSKNSRRNLYIGLGVGLSVVCLYLAFFGFFFFSMRSGVGRHSSTSEEIANSTKQLVIKPISMYWSTGEKNAMITTIGTIVNNSSFAMESPTIEIRYYNKDHQLIDVVVDAPCDLVCPEKEEVAFRVRKEAARSQDQYQSEELFIRWAKRAYR